MTLRVWISVRVVKWLTPIHALMQNLNSDGDSVTLGIVPLPHPQRLLTTRSLKVDQQQQHISLTFFSAGRHSCLSSGSVETMTLTCSGRSRGSHVILRPSCSSDRPSTPSITTTRGRCAVARRIRCAKSLTRPLKSCKIVLTMQAFEVL